MGIFRKSNHTPKGLATITAGGATFNMSDYSQVTQISLLKQDWQKRAFDIYDAEGHLFYATNYIGGALSKIQLVGATKPKSHGTLEQPTLLESGPVADAIASIESPMGGQSGFLRQIGRNIFLTGEAWVIPSLGQDGVMNWDAVSVDELVSDGSGSFKRRSLPGGNPIALPKGTPAWRIWKEHPRYSQLADAGTRSCIELLEKIIILNRAEKAVARSQLAGSGILALPQELVPPAWQNQTNLANPMEANPLWQALAESMTAPLLDESAPSAVVPLLLVGPGEIIKNIRYEPMNRVFDSAGAQASISNAIEQIANTLEIPKEILLGVGDATHWTAWAIREDVFQAHVQPLIELICAGLTRNYLKQALAQFSDAQLKDNGIDNRDDIIIWYDASQLVIQPDKGDKMLGLHDRMVITNDALAEEIGVTKEQRLDASSLEYKQRVGVKMADPGMAITGEPTPPPDPFGGMPPNAGGAGPKGVNPGRGTSPQGPRAAPPKVASQRRAQRGLPQDSKTSTLTSSAANPAAALVTFDLHELKQYREMAERHVRTSIKSIIAAATASDFIEPEFLEEFVNMAYQSWDDATGLITSLFGDLPIPIYKSVIEAAIKESSNYYLELLKGIINKKAFNGRTPIFGEFITGDIVQYGDVRPLLVQLGGGSVENPITLQGGFTTGMNMREWLRSNGIDTDKKIWLYGFDEPRRTFNGHLQMDGLVFDSWDDEALRIAPQDAWLRVPKYFPGDHFGCGCMVGPYIPNYGDAFDIDTGD